MRATASGGSEASSPTSFCALSSSDMPLGCPPAAIWSYSPGASVPERAHCAHAHPDRVRRRVVRPLGVSHVAVDVDPVRGHAKVDDGGALDAQQRRRAKVRVGRAHVLQLVAQRAAVDHAVRHEPRHQRGHRLRPAALAHLVGRERDGVARLVPKHLARVERDQLARAALRQVRRQVGVHLARDPADLLAADKHGQEVGRVVLVAARHSVEQRGRLRRRVGRDALLVVGVAQRLHVNLLRRARVAPLAPSRRHALHKGRNLRKRLELRARVVEGAHGNARLAEDARDAVEARLRLLNAPLDNLGHVVHAPHETAANLGRRRRVRRVVGLPRGRVGHPAEHELLDQLARPVEQHDDVRPQLGVRVGEQRARLRRRAREAVDEPALVPRILAQTVEQQREDERVAQQLAARHRLRREAAALRARARLAAQQLADAEGARAKGVRQHGRDGAFPRRRPPNEEDAEWQLGHCWPLPDVVSHSCSPFLCRGVCEGFPRFEVSRSSVATGEG
eukprot:6209701-Pleurochrysis_carterae.AAC.2